MSEAESSTTSTEATQETATETPAAAKVAAVQLPKLPGLPGHERTSSTHRQRLERLKAQLDEEGEREHNQRILAKHGGVEASEEETEEPFKKPIDDAARVEARRKEVEAKQKGTVAEEAAAEAPMSVATDVAETEERPAEEGAPASNAEKDRKAKFERVLALEAKAQKERASLRAEADRLKGVERQIASRIQDLEKQFAERERAHVREVDTARMILKLAQESPLELLERAGAKPEDVAKWIRDATDPTTTKLRQIEQQIADRDRQLALRERQLQEQAQQREIESRKQTVEREFLSHFEEKDENDVPVFEPALIYSQQELIRMGNELADEAAQRGLRFTTRDLAEAISELAKEDQRYKTLQRRLSKEAADKQSQSTAKTQVPAVTTAASRPVERAAKPTVVATNAAVQQSSRPSQGRGTKQGSAARKDRMKALYARLDLEE